MVMSSRPCRRFPTYIDVDPKEVVFEIPQNEHQAIYTYHILL